jgi:hypothetical protein
MVAISCRIFVLENYELSYTMKIRTVTDYRLNNWGLAPERGKTYLFYSPCPNRLSGSPTFLFSEYWEAVVWG